MKDLIQNIISSQSKSYIDKTYHSYNSRIEVLTKLKELILLNSKEIEDALFKDLGKGRFESHISEIDFTISEINHLLKNLKRMMKPTRVKSPLVHFPSKSYIHKEPLGKILVISPWNYPFQLLLSPAVGALAAGNTVVLKPSEIASATSKVITKIINKNFRNDLIICIEGGVEETTLLLENKFDHIFYTGNSSVGRIVAGKAANFLTPVTLELGGKSPCFIFGDVDLNITAKRVVWGKFFNAGQTCVAPDYVIIEENLKEEFVKKCEKYIKSFYGKSPEKSKDFGRIINERHFDRLNKLIVKEDLLIGGDSDRETKYISPTLVNANINSLIMNEEIFGPILPVICMKDLTVAIDEVRQREKPLAAYCFSNNKAVVNEVLDKVSAGGMVINDVIIHLSNPHLPFGGVGESGIGSYHGDYSFDLFSHRKAVMKRSFKFDVDLKYPPYFGKLKLIKFLLRYFG